MDPNAALSEYLQAILDRDLDRADIIHKGLIEWLSKGGFAPAYLYLPNTLGERIVFRASMKHDG